MTGKYRFSATLTNIKEKEPETTEATKPKHFFNDKARENNKKYQDLRRENKTLTDINKIYNKTKTRKEKLKQDLINNPLFIEDYERVLEA
jgi:hypothetical protein